MHPSQAFNAMGLVLAMGMAVTAATGTRPAVVSDSDRVLIEQVRLLYPGPSGFRCSEPVDLLLEGGRVVPVAPDAPIQLEPGQMRLRGQNRWLVPAPRMRVTGVPRSSDLVVAGLSGVGALAVNADRSTLEAVRARAELDTAALPVFIPSDAPVEGVVAGVPGRAPTLARLVEATGSTQALLDALSKRAGDPFAADAPVSFLMLSEDPRSVPEALLEPHAVLLGSEVILRSEQMIRLEEAVAGEELLREHTREQHTPDVGEGQSWSRRYRLVIDGLERGWALLHVDEALDGSLDAEVTASVASPLKEVLHAAVSWSAPVAETGVRWQQAISVSLNSQGRLMEARSVEGPHGRVLEVFLDGAELEGGPIALEPNELVLPHTLLILVDSALMAGTSSGGQVLELAFMNGPLELHRSPRMPLRGLRPEDTLPLDEAALRSLGGPTAAHLVGLTIEENQPASALVLLDHRRRPLLLLLETPWGYLEWSGCGGGLSGPAPAPGGQNMGETGNEVP